MWQARHEQVEGFAGQADSVGREGFAGEARHIARFVIIAGDSDTYAGLFGDILQRGIPPERVRRTDQEGTVVLPL